jgi:hypothetical protein
MPAKPNYEFIKRQKELAKQKKQDEKLRKKKEASQSSQTEGDSRT